MVNCTNVIANIVTAMAFVFGIYQFCIYQQESRGRKSSEVSQMFFNETIIKSWSTLDLTPKDRKAILYLRKNAKNDPLADKMISTYLSDKVNRSLSNFFVLTDYFNMVFFCIEKEQCESHLIGSWVKSAGRKFFRTYLEYSCDYERKKMNVSDVAVLQKVRNYYLKDKIDCSNY